MANQNILFYIFNLDCRDFYGFCSSQNFLLITCSVKSTLAFLSGINLWMILCHFVLTFSWQKKLEDTVECQLSYPSFEVAFFSYVKYKTPRCYLVLKSKPIDTPSTPICWFCCLLLTIDFKRQAKFWVLKRSVFNS